ncbi:hypothetical protein NIES4072_64310 [Nostoc commune NIES-4072]|uniref:Uncharacterized protein n=1 Tax=Nostoc commune NIES-4072 TaxID=2005467 RepID=A0A2R5FXC8_NOSCO|nr:hypothetical protein [Nostoc commune]BBD70051.1 hypothetical protein NIES4070_64620 [Nostoc commune HK-02]GBG22719.1 hypothetical protein NIES4072_64310 [Nostoc commune NIES-4072]
MAQPIESIVVKQPNTFVLHEIDLSIVYSVKDKEPKLTYSISSLPQSPQIFKGNEIRTLNTEIGTLVSVTLGTVLNPDVGGDVTTLSLLLPIVNLSVDGGSAPAHKCRFFTIRSRMR